MWGMVEVDGGAVRLLDCPIIQRLRGIKQLGFSYLTYPSAEHSRFIHSLGMACVVSRLLDSMDKRAAEKTDETDELHFVPIAELSPVTREDVVHAAILHDVGHMPFSHVSENVLRAREGMYTCGGEKIADFLADFERVIAKRLQFSEVLSLLVILSKRFSDFYSDYVRVDKEDRDALLRICCLIAGLPPEPRLSGAAELISASVIDADKIDYVNRDAEACGIPVGIDVSRIFLRSGFLRVSRDRLKKSGLKNSEHPEEILFVVNASGLDTIDEITEARAALYQRVYLHAVTRGAETIYASALDSNVLSNKKNSDLTDALGLWCRTDNAVLNELIHSADVGVSARAQRLRNRQLPKKACVFSSSIARMHFPLQNIFPHLSSEEAATIRKQVVNTPLEQLTNERVGGTKGAYLVVEIKKELTRLIKSLPKGRRKDLVPKKSLEVLEVIGSAYMDRVQKDCIVLQNGELLRPSSFTSVREQQDASDIFKAVGFVMCDAAWRDLVLVAARSVLCRVTEAPKPTALFEVSAAGGQPGTSEVVSFVPRMILDLKGVTRRSGVDPKKVRTLIDSATEGGYFNGNPLLASPTDPEAPIVADIARSLEKFDGQRSWAVHENTVAAFIDQFPPGLRASMQKLLQSDLIFFDRAEIASSLLSELNKIGRCVATALSPNSGNNARTVTADEAQGKGKYESISFKKDIRAALDDESGPLVLLDDNISSGIQATAQLYAWCGIPREKWPIECREEEGFEAALEPGQIQKLQKREIYIAVCLGRDEANKRLRRAANQLGLEKFVGARYAHSFASVEWPKELRSFLSSVGISVLAWSRYRKQTNELTEAELKECRKDMFGYGNVGGLAATSLNTPSATVTALWCPGVHNGNPWLPLIIRRKKLRHLIIG